MLDIDEKQGRQLYSKSCPNSLRNSLDSKDFEGAGEESIEASVAVASQVQQVSAASIIESQIKFDENNKPTTTLEAETTSIESKQSPRVIPVLKIRLVFYILTVCMPLLTAVSIIFSFYHKSAFL